MKKIRLTYLILPILLCCANFLFAQELSFTATVSANEVSVGERFELTFSINGNGGSFTPPDLSNFQVLGGPNQSNSMTSINGVTTVTSSLSYILVATKTGTLTIGPGQVVVKGQKISSNTVRMTVVRGQMQQRQRVGQNATEGASTDAPADYSKSLFIKVIPEQHTVFQGQQLVLKYRLYTRLDIVDSRLDKMPDLNRFWSEEVKDAQQGEVQWHVETYKGLEYNVADVKQYVLFPEHSGNITINPFEMTFIVRVPVPVRDIMDQFFGSYQEVKLNVKSAPLQIQVKPLPENGKPAGFSGAVGNFSLLNSVDKTSLKANEAINYSLKISGAGNIKLLKTTDITFPADFEKYDPKIDDTVQVRLNGVSGSRNYKYLLIPRQPGEFSIPAPQFSFFNPVTKKYVVLSGKELKIQVAKGAVENTIAEFSAVPKEDLKVLDKDIRYIKTSGLGLSSAGEAFDTSIWYPLLWMLGPVLCVGAFILRNRYRVINADIVKVKSRKAVKVASRQLENAERQLGNKKEFYEAITKGLYGYLSDKFNITLAELNREQIFIILKSAGISDSLIHQLMDTLDLCEMARYAPVVELSEREVFEKAKAVINSIEDEI